MACVMCPRGLCGQRSLHCPLTDLLNTVGENDLSMASLATQYRPLFVCSVHVHVYSDNRNGYLWKHKTHYTQKMGTSVLLRHFITSNEVCSTAYALLRIHEQNSIFKDTTMDLMILKKMKILSLL